MAATRFTHGLTARNYFYKNSAGQKITPGHELIMRQLVVPISFADGTTTVTTTITLPANTIIMPYPTAINVLTAEATGATKTIQVGITGTAGAFVNGVSVASTGLIQPVLTFGAVTLGSKLQVFSGTGSTAPVPTPDIEATAVALTWTPGSADWANFVGEIHLTYFQYGDLTVAPVNENIANIDSI